MVKYMYDFINNVQEYKYILLRNLKEEYLFLHIF
jgi:hypothetical protein